MSDLLYQQETYLIRGACFEVYREKGHGFVEPVYQECLETELSLHGTPFVPKPRLELEYKGRPLRATYEPDFICYNRVVVEIKAVTKLAEEHRSQLHNYLKATGHRLGLLVNFGHYPGIEIERIIR